MRSTFTGFGYIFFTVVVFLLSEYDQVANAELDPLSKSTFKYYLNEYAYQKSNAKFKVINSELIPKTSTTLCTACNWGAQAFITLRRIGVSKGVYSSVAKFVCKVAGVDADVCNGAVDIHVDLLLHIIDQTPSLTGARVCAVYLQGSGCEQPEGYDWTVEVPPYKSSVKKSHKKYMTKAKPLKIAHISDIHYEPEYVVGSLADCSQPVCCVNSSGYPQSDADIPAGAFGMYGDCDTPWVTVLSTFETIAKYHPDVDLIYYSGDTVHHQVWDTSVDGNSKDLNTILELMNNSLPNVPVFPVIGNHEPSPVNAFAPSNVTDDNLTSSWLYELFAKNLENWFSSDVLDTMKKGGYFTTKISDKLRIVALNSNLCLIENWWLFYKEYYVDPEDQLKWFIEVLLKAEENGEKVHVILHIISANNDCLQVWSREYRKIVDRFSDTIVAHFYGHSHRDDYMLYFDSDEPTKPVSVGFNAGSVQPGINPNFVIYHVHPENFEIYEKEVWIFNLTEANSNPSQGPNWYKLYDFRDEFGVSDLSPRSLFQLVKDMAKNATLREKYVSFRYKGEEVSCDDSCYRNVLCRIVQPQVGDSSQCEIINDLYE